MEELIEVIQGLKQPGCIDYIQLGSAIVSVIASIISVLVAIGVPKTIAENQNKIALFEKRYELFQFYRKCQSFLYLELSSQMQRYIKINFKRRFPVQAFAWTLI